MYQPSTLSPALLTKALLRAVEQLGLVASLPPILRASPEEAAQLQSGARLLDPARPEWDAALKVVALFRSSVEMLGTAERARIWLGTENETLGGRPADLLASPDAELVYRYISSVRKHEIRMPPGRRGH
jgi:hypothetical protein